MIRNTIGAVALAALITTPAHAIGIEDLAKVVLGGNSVLKKAEKNCGDQGKLTLTESSTLDSAVDIVRKKLVPETFNALDNVAQADANTQSQASTFCPETKKKKKGLLSKVKKAGRDILLGGIGL